MTQQISALPAWGMGRTRAALHGAAATVVVLGALAWAGDATAQDETPPPETTADGATAPALGAAATDASGEVADVITVYGTSNPLPVFKYPGQVSVVGRTNVDVFAPSAISDLLRDVPGLEFSGGPRRTGETPALRGLSDQNVLILVDGARQSFNSAHDGRFFIDPDLIGTAEVVRGPASALYGSGAVGGVLAFETVDAADLLRGGEDFGLRLRTGYQDSNEEVFGSATAFGMIGGVDLVGSIGVRRSGDIELGDGTTLPSDDEILSSLLKAEYDLTQALRIEASWARFENNAVEPNNGQGVVLADDPVLSADVEKEVITNTFRGAVAFDPRSAWIDARVTGYFTDTGVEEVDSTFFDPDNPDVVGRTVDRDVETIGVNARNVSRFSIANLEAAATVGIDWFEDSQDGRDSNVSDLTRSGVPNGSTAFLGVFAQLETSIERPLGLPGDLVFIPSIRFDEFESEVDGEFTTDDDAFSPRVAGSYGPVEWLRVFASYSEAFRAPSIGELFLEGPHFPQAHPVLSDFTVNPPVFVPVFNNFVPNADLEPEETQTIEVGAGVDFRSVLFAGDRLQAKASYYQTDAEGLIDIFVLGANGAPFTGAPDAATFSPTCFAPPFFPCAAGTTESRNVDDAELDGIEVEAIYDSRRLRAQATYATVNGEDTATGADIGTLTPDRFNLDVRGKFPEWGVDVGGRVQLANEFRRFAFDSDQDALVLAEERASYAVLDLYASWRPRFLEGVRVDAGVDNVFDTDYERVFEGVSEPGINPRVAVSYQLAFGGGR